VRDEDEVDGLLAAWQRERPDLDVRPLAVLSRVTRLARHLDRARRAAFAEHGLEAFEFDVLAALRRAGPPYELTPGRLLRETLVGSGTMTNRLDRLEGRGLVRRLPDPADGRAVRVRLTVEGRSRVDGAVSDLLHRERAVLAGLPAADRERLADLLRSLLMRVEDRTTGE
jgi:DNA-binding MarR family transcriptional regulator